MNTMKLMTALTAFALAIGNGAHAQYSRYGAIENFYQANPDLDTNQYAGRVVKIFQHLTKTKSGTVILGGGR